VAKSTRRRRKDKPDKPYDGYPLFAHLTKRWAKKIRGKLHYFGPWSDPMAALNKYLEQKDDLHAGRKPREPGSEEADGPTLQDLANRFLTTKIHKRDAREITSRTFAEYKATCERVIQAFGLTRLLDDLRPEDFEQFRATLATTRGPVALKNEIQRVRVLFKYAFDQGVIDRPIRYGQSFDRPSKHVLRKEKAKRAPRMFEGFEIRAMVDGALVVGEEGPELVRASAPMRAMILLGINCGFGNTDVGRLPLTALDLERGWVNFARPKTGISRRCPLWPETVAALQEAIADRPAPVAPADADLVFVTKYGGGWAKETRDNPVTKEVAKLLRAFGLARAGVNFYALRHGFETIGGEAHDQAAVDHIMGHARDDMASNYRERISDERLKAVTDRVRRWLYPESAQAVVGLQHIA
jgi:integrase